MADIPNPVFWWTLITGQDPYKRRRTTRRERTTPCNWCGYPLTQRHHLSPISIRGESDNTIQLCANCHELYHLAEAAITHNSKWALTLLATFGSGDNERLKRLKHAIKVV